jgi:glutathione S-transferase
MTEKPTWVLRSTLTSPFGRKVRMAMRILGLDRHITIVPADTLDEADTLR